MSKREIICRCEEVTKEEIIQALQAETFFRSN